MQSLLKVNIALFILLYCFMSSYACISHANEQIIINQQQSSSLRYQYSQDLLMSALDRTITSHGEYEILDLIKLGTQDTSTLMGKKNYGDVIQGASRPEWEENLLPIRIPILKGLHGVRLFVINKEMQAIFNNINSLEQLKALSLGTGENWTITKVFKHYNFNIVPVNNASFLYNMLEKKRFDCLSRGLHEVLIEYEANRKKNKDLHIEETILLHIPLPAYFFVNPTKPKLAERITQGLKLLIKDGSFDKIFFKHFGDTIEQLNLSNRKIYHLENTVLSTEIDFNSSLDFLEKY